MLQSTRSSRFSVTHLARIILGLSVTLLAVTCASAQYGGGGGTGGTGGGTGGTYSGGGYGSSAGKAAGIGIGAGAGVGLLIYALHHHPGMTGCVQPADDGLRIVDEKKNTSYPLQTGDVIVKPGQRVQLQGKLLKSSSGTQSFAAKKLVKDLGSCSSTTAATQNAPASN